MHSKTLAPMPTGLALSAMMLASAALAADAPATPAEGATADTKPAKPSAQEIVVEGVREQRLSSPKQTKPLLDTPQTITVVPASVMQQQGAIGELAQYGLSARALAVDTVVYQVPEEFPDFTHVWFETPAPGADSVVVYALLDGASVAGAYRFTMRRDAKVVIDVDSFLVLRRDVARLGIAPLTSMFWYSETAKPTMVDWRPEIHDSDGLALWTGSGERIWRPLNNPPGTQVSAFSDASPRGFGLLQRDRVFDHYQDGVYYDRRPSLWIEPRGDWGRGSVQLVENPTDDEIHDNIVAMWVPAERANAGKSFDLSYRTTWAADEPSPTALARCVATRLGNGGAPGTARPRGVRKFLIEFLGGPLKDLPTGVLPEPVLTASRGTFSYVRTEAVPDDVPGHWRTQFDLTADGPEPVELRCFLRGGTGVLSETWLYQYHPVG